MTSHAQAMRTLMFLVIRGRDDVVRRKCDHVGFAWRSEMQSHAVMLDFRIGEKVRFHPDGHPKWELKYCRVVEGKAVSRLSFTA